MRRKIALMLTGVMLAMGLVACGEKDETKNDRVTRADVEVKTTEKPGTEVLIDDPPETDPPVSTFGKNIEDFYGYWQGDNMGIYIAKEKHEIVDYQNANSDDGLNHTGEFVDQVFVYMAISDYGRYEWDGKSCPMRAVKIYSDGICSNEDYSPHGLNMYFYEDDRRLEFRDYDTDETVFNMQAVYDTDEHMVVSTVINPNYEESTDEYDMQNEWNKRYEMTNQVYRLSEYAPDSLKNLQGDSSWSGTVNCDKDFYDDMYAGWYPYQATGNLSLNLDNDMINVTEADVFHIDQDGDYDDDYNPNDIDFLYLYDGLNLIQYPPLMIRPANVWGDFDYSDFWPNIDVPSTYGDLYVALCNVNAEGTHFERELNFGALITGVGLEDPGFIYERQ